MTGPTIYTATDREWRLAMESHSGQASMLYAVASTGALSTGYIRPSGCETDAEWERDLLERLGAELAEVAGLGAQDPTVADDVEVADAWRGKLAPLWAERAP